MIAFRDFTLFCIVLQRLFVLCSAALALARSVSSARLQAQLQRLKLAHRIQLQAPYDRLLFLHHVVFLNPSRSRFFVSCGRVLRWHRNASAWMDLPAKPSPTTALVPFRVLSFTGFGFGFILSLTVVL